MFVFLRQTTCRGMHMRTTRKHAQTCTRNESFPWYICTCEQPGKMRNARAHRGGGGINANGMHVSYLYHRGKKCASKYQVGLYTWKNKYISKNKVTCGVDGHPPPPPLSRPTAGLVHVASLSPSFSLYLSFPLSFSPSHCIQPSFTTTSQYSLKTGLLVLSTRLTLVPRVP